MTAADRSKGQHDGGMTRPERILPSGFLQSCERFGTRPAVEVNGETLSYSQLRDQAASWAATLHLCSSDGPPLTAIFAYRSATAYAGILSALFRGHGYVPLNPTFPSDRTRILLQRSGSRSVIVDESSEPQLEAVLSGIDYPVTLLLPHRNDAGDLAMRWPHHRLLVRRDLEPASSWRPLPVSADEVAYLLFTSGSTGVPKGVMVRHRNVLAFLDAVLDRYDITENDRFSQMFDMTFDLSVFDMFVAWERGACVCCPTAKEVIKPGRFISDSRLTIWFSVPSSAVFMQRLGMLKPHRYPGLRWSLFCGEALPLDIAQSWLKAAPNSTVENLYGPTELTVACTWYRLDPQRTPAESQLGLVPIGDPFPGMAALIVDDRLQEVDVGQSGELVLTGPQLSGGYWQDQDKTAAAFVSLGGRDGIFYRTGDRVKRSRCDGPLLYLGRIDNQIKILGHRVEPGEIEAVLREESGVSTAVAVGWPLTPSGAAGIVAFLCTATADVDSIRERVNRRLPQYLAPREYRLVPNMPLNVNGKVDRKALLEKLETP